MLASLNPDPTLQTLFQVTLDQLDGNTNSSSPPHHKLYKKNFNVIDLHDRLWYQYYWKFHVKKWRTKFLFSFFRTGLLNSFTVISELQQETLFAYRCRVLEALLSYEG
jgi:hypothetical protein